MVLTYFLNDFEMVPVAPVITGITLVFTFPHTLYFYCKVLIFHNLIIIIIIVCSGCAAQRGLWPPRSRGFVITHNDAPQSVRLLWTSDQLVTEIST
jgi:hypothetical protein